MSTHRIVVLGAGGHAQVVLDTVRAANLGEIVGVLTPDEALWGCEAFGVPVLGGDDLLPEVRDSGVTHGIVGVGSVGDATTRMRLLRLLVDAGLVPLLAVHPQAVVASSARLGPGSMVFATAVINPGARIGTNVVLNTGCIVEHDCEIGDHAHVATGATLAGGVCVEEEAHIGAGATVLGGLRIGRGAVVGAGAVVTRDVSPGTMVVGVPARVLPG